jgi:uncharacterized protein (DUF2062 family)
LQTQPRKNFFRWLKYKYFQLLRTPGGPKIVARGFAIGIMVEFITLPTGGLAFFLIFPLTWMMRASLAGTLIGYVFGKILYLPFSPLSYLIGDEIIPHNIEQSIPHGFERFFALLPELLQTAIVSNVYLLAGGMVVGLGLGFLSYFLILMLLRARASRRVEKRRKV